MNFFYEDDTFIELENGFCWKESLDYLESLYLKNPTSQILCTIVASAWYYFIEGACISKEWKDTDLLLNFWKKYIDLGLKFYPNDPYFNFVGGYTLSLHGFFFDAEYGGKWEDQGKILMQKCYSLSKNLPINRLAENFLLNDKSKKHIPLKGGESICSELFSGKSLINQYFYQIYYGGDIMFRFDGELSTVSKLYLMKLGQKGQFAGAAIGLIPLAVLFVIFALNASMLLLLFVPVILGCIVVAGLYKPNDWNKTAFEHIKIDKELIAFEFDKYTEKKTEDVKKVLDYGEFYEFRFYFPWCFGVICQKDLLVEGTIEEFEQFFDGKIVRKKLKLKA